MFELRAFRRNSEASIYGFASSMFELVHNQGRGFKSFPKFQKFVLQARNDRVALILTAVLST